MIKFWLQVKAEKRCSIFAEGHHCCSRHDEARRSSGNKYTPSNSPTFGAAGECHKYFEFGSNWVIFDVSLAAQRVLTVHSMYSRGVGSNISVLDVTYLSRGSRPKGLVCCGVR